MYRNMKWALRVNLSHIYTKEDKSAKDNESNFMEFCANYVWLKWL